MKYYECLFLSEQYKKAGCLTFQQTQECHSKASQSFTQSVSNRLRVHNNVYRVIFQSLVKIFSIGFSVPGHIKLPYTKLAHYK